jgi:hypothetical protein
MSKLKFSSRKKLKSNISKERSLDTKEETEHSLKKFQEKFREGLETVWKEKGDQISFNIFVNTIGNIIADSMTKGKKSVKYNWGERPLEDVDALQGKIDQFVAILKIDDMTSFMKKEYGGSGFDSFPEMKQMWKDKFDDFRSNILLDTDIYDMLFHTITWRYTRNNPKELFEQASKVSKKEREEVSKTVGYTD